ncbi:hypothetical protein CRES_0658 [Corynebacterium resistens DSM 45100]|uniref:DUF2786 domain-containing protein n=1 Tax=Corynebacterium resistens (strain DSM 45100 / JCM 12819 / GTC 2026 / SICGH 158) TaxID=662755 RepID=F8DZC2_CORRG|nr:DUF2786 domain-containing protein [Corynebacterium resistens]AEI09016.1 hypothetical protein CRES_0658 [Corynebacterium resistens DSM 45100]
MMADSDELAAMKEKVQKLLALARDRQGTPEGETFENKAFELMAKYGVSAAALEADGNGSDRQRARISRHRQNFSGPYTDMQFSLFNGLSAALHCHTLRFKVHGSVRVEEAIMFGRPHHVDRVVMLHSLLLSQMLAGAYDASLPARLVGISVQTQRRSWMTGFIASVCERLAEIERAHAAEYSTEATAGALVLQSDSQLAMDAAAEEFPYATKQRIGRRQFDPASFANGVASGETMDLGQTRVSQRRALPSG